MKKPPVSAGGLTKQKETNMTIVNQSAVIQIDRIAAETIRVPIVGTAPLIVHNWSEKSKRQMLEAQQGKKRLKEARDPQAEFEAAFYRIIDPASGELSYGFPVTAFKAATVGAARFYGKDISMTALRQLLFMRGVLTEGDPQQLVAIEGEPRMREDMVRVGMGGSDLRYRPEFPTWSAHLEVTFITSSISRQSVLSLIDAAGMGIGVGEWRPEKRGEFGTYAVDQSKTVEVLS